MAKQIVLHDKCAACGEAVPKTHNWLRANPSGTEALFHWHCFFLLSRGQDGALAVERAAWQAERRVN